MVNVFSNEEFLIFAVVAIKASGRDQKASSVKSLLQHHIIEIFLLAGSFCRKKTARVHVRTVHSSTLNCLDWEFFKCST